MIEIQGMFQVSRECRVPDGCTEGAILCLGDRLTDGAGPGILQITLLQRAPADLSDPASLRRWMIGVGTISAIIEQLAARRIPLWLLGPEAATTAAVHLLVRQPGVIPDQLRAQPDYRADLLDWLAQQIPGKRMVAAPSVQPPRITPPISTVTPAPPPQSGMRVAPIVGAQPGQPASVVADHSKIDDALAVLGGFRPGVIGEVPEKPPEKPNPAEMETVIRVTDSIQGVDRGQTE